HVQRETLPGKKHRMSAGSNVLNALEIIWPRQVGRVERTRYGEATSRPTARRRAHKLFERPLTVGAVGAEIAEIPVGLQRTWTMAVWVDPAVERPCRARAILALDAAQRWSTGEREVEI